MIAKRLEVSTPLRGLKLAVSTTGGDRDISALIMDPKSGRALAYAGANRDDIYLSMAAGDEALWVGRAVFDLPRASCEQLVATFGFPVRDQQVSA